MNPEIIRDGKLDRAAAAEPLRKFLDELIGASGLELRVTVRAVTSAGTGLEGDAEVLADLDGADKGILLERNAEVLKATVVFTFVEPSLHPGERIFDVFANGQKVLTNLDVAEAAGALTAYQRKVEVNAREGKIILEFKPAKGDAIVSAIEVR